MLPEFAMKESSPKQEVVDIASSIASALLAKVGLVLSDHVFRNCCFMLATEAAKQRRTAFDRLTTQPRFADAQRDLLNQQHRDWVIALLFGTVVHPDFQPDVPAQFEQVVRSVLIRTENMMVFCPELFG
jgi:hypothetical protein